MAREAYRSIYGDLTKLKDDSVLKDPAAGPDDDDELFELLLAVSDWIDRYCNRHFYPRIETLLFDGNGDDRLTIPDLIALLQLDEAAPDGQYCAPGRQWSGDAVRLIPYNAAPRQPWGHPYAALRVRQSGAFPPGEANLRIRGVWGYRMFAEPAGAALAADAAPNDARITVTDGRHFRIGQTILPGGLPAPDPEPPPQTAAAEQALVTAVSGNTLTIARGLNGAAPAAHAAETPISILRWPPSIERAALIQTARIWTRAADFEPFYVDSDIDTDVRLLLEPYRKPPTP